MDFKCEDKVDYFYLILSLLSLAFNITTSYFLPKFYYFESDSCNEQIYNDIDFCNRLTNTILVSLWNYYICLFFIFFLYGLS